MSPLNSLALFGMGGVGKTQIATQYAYQSLDKFDAVLWMASDNVIAIGQSFRTVAGGLSLLGTDDETKNAAGASWKAKSWLLTTSKSSVIGSR